jgi:hypothetical protein
LPAHLETLFSYRSRRLPHSLIIGVRKGGTRALLDALALHPHVRVARHELHFFNSNDTYAKGVDWYREQMPLAHDHQVGRYSTGGGYVQQVIIEKTPGYFASHWAPERVYRMNPQMKLMLILRDPVTRTVSDFTQVLVLIRLVGHLQVYQTKLERHKEAPIFEALAFTSSNDLNERYKPIRNSLYELHMWRWLNFFPIDQFLFIDGERFITDPLHEVRSIHLMTS